MENIIEVAKKIGLENNLELYGKYMAKIDFLNLLKNKESKGKLILVTAISPTPAGEGKTTTSIGLSMSLWKLGKKSIVSIRQPSMGPVFGIKGGATGGGKSKVEPSDKINLSFTGDFYAISQAHNLLSALINNHLYHGNHLRLDVNTIQFNRTIDMNDRSLRSIIVGVDGKESGILSKDSFLIVPASEIMAIVGLSKDYNDLKRRLGNIYIGKNFDGKNIYARDLKADGAMAAILSDALKPNLVQTSESTPALVHTGPFGNIAHGTSSMAALRVALSSGDYVITEAGFGSDLGAEKFFDIACRTDDLKISAVVLVATIRSLKYHGGTKDYENEDLKSLESGFDNLRRHIAIIRRFGFDPVVAINRFSNDTQGEVNLLEELLKKEGVKYSLSTIYSDGSSGGLELAERVIEACNDTPKTPIFAYNLNESIQNKILDVARKVYGASDAIFSKAILKKINDLEKNGYGMLPICMAKTQYSLTDNPALLKIPDEFKITVSDIRLSSGAGFIVVYLGQIMTMPGLPAHPASENIDIDSNGNISGLF
jgi:formate--tetrahydrofolate ligase